MENNAFSTSGQDAISRIIDTRADDTADRLSPREFEIFYDIDRTANEIIQGAYKRISLQFPDELLHYSVPIYRALKSKIGHEQELFVLADTSYGSCCVDEVAAQHVDADAVVHYGHACMSQTYRLPVIYVFGQKPLDVDDCVSRLLEIFQSTDGDEPSNRRQTVVFKHEVAFAHHSAAVVRRLRERLEGCNTRVLYSEIPLRLNPVLQSGSATLKSPREAEIEDCTIFYLGGESIGLTNLLITHSSCDVFSYDPAAKLARLESNATNKLLMRRYTAVQKAKDSDVFGILVGTLGVASYLPLISHIRTLLSKAHKKSYTISVGKLNPSKLANFMEIECWVLVACPENSLIEAKEFLRPIVTPYELEVALRAEQTWTGRYILDFEKLLAGHPAGDDVTETGEEQENDLDQPIFSLITGKYRQAKRYGEQGTSSDQMREIAGQSAIILRNQENTVSTLPNSAAGRYLQERTYQGLETRVGEDGPSVLEQGRSGIARGYQDDHK